MSEKENHFTVFIRLPFKRGDFVDPPPVAWSASKERELWDIISRQSKGNEIDWSELAARFQVTQQFLLQQAAWLYERQLSQVRAQMRRMGSRQSATASPAPSSTTASVVGAQPSKRPAALASRGPSRLSTQVPAVATQGEGSTPNTPVRSKSSLTLKSNTAIFAAGSGRSRPTPPRPLSRKSSKDIESGSRTHSRRGSTHTILTKSPGDIRPAESSSSEDENITKPNLRRPNQVSAQRRTSLSRKAQYAKTSSRSVNQLQEEREEDEDEDDPAFLPFATTSTKDDNPPSNISDPSATLRAGLVRLPPSTTAPPSTSARPPLQRKSTSERVQPTQATNTGGTATTVGFAATPVAAAASAPKQSGISPQPQYHTQLTSSNSSLSSNNAPPHPTSSRPATTIGTSHNATTATATATAVGVHPNHPTTTSHRAPLQTIGNLPTPLSPRQQAALANAAGLSPRRRAVANPSKVTTQQHQQQHQQHGHHHHHTGYTGSESSPSMGSSFSDLDDASVTQSALEEALMSNMNALGSTTATVPTTASTTTTSNAGAVSGIGGAFGSRVSGIGQALRSRYFDARTGPATANNSANVTTALVASVPVSATSAAPRSLGGGADHDDVHHDRSTAS